MTFILAIEDIVLFTPLVFIAQLLGARKVYRALPEGHRVLVTWWPVCGVDAFREGTRTLYMFVRQEQPLMGLIQGQCVLNQGVPLGFPAITDIYHWLWGLMDGCIASRLVEGTELNLLGCCKTKGKT